MTDANDQSIALTRAMDTIAQSDPLLKLLHEVRLGRMKPTDAGLRVVTEAWLSTYKEVLEKCDALDVAALRRLNPSPRLEVLIEAGVLPPDHAGVTALQATYLEAVAARGG